MKTRKVLCLAIVAIMVSAFTASASLLPENALVARAGDSVYGVLGLEDTGAFLRWLASEENINLAMPFILKSKDSNDIIAAIEFIRAFTEKTPIKSAAIIAGSYDPDKKLPPFFQLAFTVDPSMSSTVKKIAEGSASDSDFAKLILGNDNPITAIAQTMIKAEKLNGNIYRIDNELFLKAEDDLLVMATSESELADSLKALRDDKDRLFVKGTRKFTDKNFAYVHADLAVMDKLDTDNTLKSADQVVNIFDKPLNFELGFTSEPEKFIMSLTINLLEATKKEYAVNASDIKSPVKGSFLTLSGTKSPLLATSGYLTLSVLKAQKDSAELLNELIRQARVRFGISEEEFTSFFDAAFSLTVNDNVTFEGFKIPAVYISRTGGKDAAAKIFSRLTKSSHLKKVKDGVLQLDSSISPVPCFIQDNGETFSINFAELQNIGAKPTLKPALESLVNAKGIGALWLDFDGIRNWIMDDENGVMATLLPMAKIMGYGEIADAANDILTAEYSVPSFSFRTENAETLRFEFANQKINPENGLFARILKIYQKFSK